MIFYLFAFTSVVVFSSELKNGGRNKRGIKQKMKNFFGSNDNTELIKTCMDDHKMGRGNLDVQAENLKSLKSYIEQELTEVYSEDSISQLHETRLKPCKGVMKQFKMYDVTEFGNNKAYNFMDENTAVGSVSVTQITEQILFKLLNKDKLHDEELLKFIEKVVTGTYTRWKTTIKRWIEQRKSADNLAIDNQPPVIFYSTADSGLSEHCDDSGDCSISHFMLSLEFNTETTRTNIISTGSTFNSFIDHKNRPMNDIQRVYFLLKAERRKRQSTYLSLATLLRPVDENNVECDKKLKNLIVPEKTEQDCENEIKNRGGSEKTLQTSKNPRSRRAVDDLFMFKFSRYLKGYHSHLARSIKARHYERTACLYDRLDAKEHDVTDFDYELNKSFEDIKLLFKRVIKKNFGDKKQCLSYKEDRHGILQHDPTHCLTDMLQDYRETFIDVISRTEEQIKNDIKTGRVDTVRMNDFDGLENLGEYADMHFKFYYTINDDSSHANAQDEEIQCFWCEDNDNGCSPECLQQPDTDNGPKSMNFAIYLHYSERKIDEAAFSILHSESQLLTTYLRPEEIKSYFYYLQIERAEWMGTTYNELQQLSKIRGVRDRNLIENVIEEIETNNCETGDCGQGPVCNEVIKTMQACWNNEKQRHFIFGIQVSSAVTDENIEEMQDALEAFLHYVLASGKNRVTIFQWSETQKVYCTNMQNANSINEECFKGKKRLHAEGNADTPAALDFVREKHLLDGDNTVIMFTDGDSQWEWLWNWGSLETASHKLQIDPRVEVVLALGIKQQIQDTQSGAYKELITIASYPPSRNVKKLADYRDFETRRFEYQQFFCQKRI